MPSNYDMSLRAESLSFLRRLPSIISANIKTRTRGKFLWSSSLKDCRADLRGNVLVLEFEHSDLDANGNYFPMPARALIIALEGASIQLAPAHHGRHPVRIHRVGARAIEMSFETTEDATAWLSALSNSASTVASCLHDFRPISRLGAGHFGSVYLAEHIPTGENLAVKVLDKARSLEMTANIRCLADERQLHELLGEHPFVISLRYAFESAKYFNLVFEICPGGSLHHYMRRHGALPEKQARRVAAEVLLGLEHLHKHGAVYRDLKPGNVLLSADGHVRIADFGLAKLLAKCRSTTKLDPPASEWDGCSSEEMDVLPRTDTMCGTLAFCAPEVVNSVSYGQKVDIWAFGVFLYDLMASKRPFKNQRAIENAAYNSIQFPDSFSMELKGLLWHLFKKDPWSRPDISFIKNHRFFRGIDWEGVRNMEPHPDNIGVIGFDAEEGSTEGLNTFRFGRRMNAAELELPGYGFDFEAKATEPAQ